RSTNSSAHASASQGQKSRPSQASSGQPLHKFNGARPEISPYYLAWLLAARGVRERSMHSLLLDRSIYIIGILNSYIENLQESRISVDDTKRVLQSRGYVAL
ncbi:MAG: hypothetical protein ACLPOA_19895, partial [Methylocella sp.]